MRSDEHDLSNKPCQRHNDSRSAWLAIMSQHAGKDKWDSDIKN